jgi:trans-aconitate methyltransferase
MWDPSKYRQFSDERSRAFYELINRIGATDPPRPSRTSAAGPASSPLTCAGAGRTRTLLASTVRRR